MVVGRRTSKEERTGRMSKEERTSVEKRKRVGALSRQEEESRRALLRGGENATASDVGATKTPGPNGATECDVSGLRATRRTCTVDTSQTKGVPSLFGSGKKTREDDEERAKASERDGVTSGRAKQRGRQGTRAEREEGRDREESADAWSRT